MTERRRFFPARPVQQVPGRTVDMTGRLKPVPEVPAPAATGGGGGDVVGVAWLLDPPENSISTAANMVKEGWRVVSLDWEMNGELEGNVRAVPVGASDVEWTWVIDETPLGPGSGVDWEWAGFTVTVQDGTALVTLGLGSVTDSTFRYASILLTAMQNGELVGELSMRATLNGWAE